MRRACTVLCVLTLTLAAGGCISNAAPAQSSCGYDVQCEGATNRWWRRALIARNRGGQPRGSDTMRGSQSCPYCRVPAGGLAVGDSPGGTVLGLAEGSSRGFTRSNAAGWGSR